MAKNWDLKQFLEKASRAEIMDLKVQRILCTPGRHTRQKQMKNSHSQQTTYQSALCNYCGLSGVHPKGYNCPAYNKYFIDVKSLTILPEYVGQPDVSAWIDQHGRTTEERILTYWKKRLIRVITLQSILTTEEWERIRQIAFKYRTK